MFFYEKNPFFTMGYGGPEYFCDRVAETNELISALVNGRNVALISPRRLGKTGLIHHVFHHLQHDDSNRRCFYIDIYNTQNQQELVQLLAQAIVGSMDKFSEKIFTQLTAFFKSCRPVFSADPITGAPEVTLDVQPQNSEYTLKEIVAYMNESEHECFVAIDEFQQIMEYPEKGTEALLRSVVQFAPNVHFIYAGSKQHLMSEMFTSPRRPFYQSTQHMGLKPLDENVYYEFASRLMANGGKTLPKEVFAQTYHFAHGFTYYIQDIMNRLFAMPETEITIHQLQSVFQTLTNEGETVYKDYCDLLAKGQLKLLRAIAKEDVVEKPHEASFMLRHNLKAISSVKLALEALLKKTEWWQKENKAISSTTATFRFGSDAHNNTSLIMQIELEAVLNHIKTASN
ncbi:MAG: ATP-binding protein [Porphyromonadaceae bacterium]|nr:MAG: ATP-binding protein [Porphyromonadaceae bacterium]